MSKHLSVDELRAYYLENLPADKTRDEILNMSVIELMDMDYFLSVEDDTAPDEDQDSV